MSRSGYVDYCDGGDCDHPHLYRAAVDRALHGRRGQSFLRELASALDAMPERVLIAGELINEHGECCAIGAVCKARSLDVRHIDYEEPSDVAKAIGVAMAMAAEIAYMNDEDGSQDELPSERWTRMRKWVADNLAETPTPTT